jgi:predicted GIY-YIG superfamily endonuclease
VLWKVAPDLFGVQTFGATPVNFDKQIGVYLLHDGREVIYVGQAISQTIGERLFQHIKDRFSGRWDRFSWFGLYSVNEDGTLKIYDETHREISIENIGHTLEAVLIESIEPRQNRKSGNKFSGLEFNQFEDPEIERKRAKKILDDLKNKL